MLPWLQNDGVDLDLKEYILNYTQTSVQIKLQSPHNNLLQNIKGWDFLMFFSSKWLLHKHCNKYQRKNERLYYSKRHKARSAKMVLL